MLPEHDQNKPAESNRQDKVVEGVTATPAQQAQLQADLEMLMGEVEVTPEQQAAYNRRARFQEIAQYIDGLIFEGKVKRVELLAQMVEGSNLHVIYHIAQPEPEINKGR